MAITGISMGYQWLLSINGLLMVINDELMWVKQCHKPPVTGNGNQAPINMMSTGGWFMKLFYPH